MCAWRSLAAVLAIGSVAAGYANSRSDPTAQFSLSTNAAGASARHTVTLEIAAGDPELHRATIAYPDGFRVAGFESLGALGSAVGSIALDFDFDGTADRVLPLRSVNHSTAYVDVVPDGAFAASIEPSLTVAARSLELRLPAGGDANTDTIVVPFAARMTLVLNPGVIVNPPLGGDYPVGVELRSGAPQVSRLTLSIHINGPTLTPFTRLTIDHFKLHEHERDRGRHDGFVAGGRFVLGGSSDGINTRADDVSVSFASFAQTIPANALRSHGPIAREYRGDGPGIRRLRIWPDGRFEIDVSELHLIIIPGALQTFSLRLGNDHGATVVAAPVKPGKDRR